MRQDLLALVGGTFYYKCDRILQIGDIDCISFSRDDDGYLLLNMRMPSLETRPRARIEENVWSVVPYANEVIAPPHGRLIEVRYANGDLFRVEFRSIETADELEARYPQKNTRAWSATIPFPITLVGISETTAGYVGLEFSPEKTMIGGIQLENGLISKIGGVVFKIQVPPDQIARLFRKDEGWFFASRQERDRVIMEVSCQLLYAQSAVPAGFTQAVHALNLGFNVQFEPTPPATIVAIFDLPESEAYPMPLTFRLMTNGKPVGFMTGGKAEAIEMRSELHQPEGTMPGPTGLSRVILTIPIPPIPLDPGKTYVWSVNIGDSEIGSSAFRTLSSSELQNLTNATSPPTD